MIYNIPQIEPFLIEASDWNAHPWNAIPPGQIANHMGAKPDHFPDVQVRAAWDPETLYVMFKAQDRYVRAVAQKDQDDVYKDSCVEFFFSPGSDLSVGYFNLEINCSGKILFHFQKTPRKDPVVISNLDCKRIRRVHSLPERVDPEIREAVTWTVAYAIPFSLLEKYCPPAKQFVKPGADEMRGQNSEVQWRGNFYKCADGSSHPHWLTWTLVDLPAPDFHHPPSFGLLQFQRTRIKAK